MTVILLLRKWMVQYAGTNPMGAADNTGALIRIRLPLRSTATPAVVTSVSANPGAISSPTRYARGGAPSTLNTAEPCDPDEINPNTATCVSSTPSVPNNRATARVSETGALLILRAGGRSAGEGANNIAHHNPMPAAAAATAKTRTARGAQGIVKLGSKRMAERNPDDESEHRTSSV